jgi:rubrerythrin
VTASRRQLLLGGAAASLALARPAAAAEPSAVEQLERLLVLERRLEHAYDTALARGAIEPELGDTLLAHEREHVRGLEQALRGLGRREPRAGAPPPEAGAAFESRRAFARYALDLEDRTVRAYEQVLATLRAERLLQPLGSIMASGAQHMVALRQVAGDDLLGVP